MLKQIKYDKIFCLNDRKNLILVPIERFSVVLRHANLLFLNFFKLEEIRCRGEENK